MVYVIFDLVFYYLIDYGIEIYFIKKLLVIEDLVEKCVMVLLEFVICNIVVGYFVFCFGLEEGMVLL